MNERVGVKSWRSGQQSKEYCPGRDCLSKIDGNGEQTPKACLRQGKYNRLLPPTFSLHLALFTFASPRTMAMEHDRTHSAPQKSALSPLLSDFLGLVRSSNNPSRNDSSVVDSLVAFRQNTQAPLSLQDLTIAFRKSLLCKNAVSLMQYTFLSFGARLARLTIYFPSTYVDARPSALHTKVFVTDWLSDLVKSSSHTKAPTAVIQELAKVYPLNVVYSNMTSHILIIPQLIKSTPTL